MTENRASPSAAHGLFASLAEEQLGESGLGPPGLGTPGGLRPRLPYVFDADGHGFDQEGELEGHDLPDSRAPALEGPSRSDIRVTERAAALPVPEPLRKTSDHRRDAAPEPNVPLQRPAAQAEARPAAAHGRQTLAPALPQPPVVPASRSEPRTDHSSTLTRLVPTQSSSGPRSRGEDAPPRALAASVQRALAATPQRLMPRVPAATLARLGSPTDAAREPSIEIHIGRVEVRALLTPAAPATAARAPQADQRLANYLHARNRGARS